MYQLLLLFVLFIVALVCMFAITRLIVLIATAILYRCDSNKDSTLARYESEQQEGDDKKA